MRRKFNWNNESPPTNIDAPTRDTIEASSATPELLTPELDTPEMALDNRPRRNRKAPLLYAEEFANMIPPGRRSISTKFIFKRKLGVDGTVKRYKARLVVHGNLQEPGVDYEETYAPVVDWEVTLTAISVMLHRDAHIELVDFQTAFLNGDLEEEVYVCLPRVHDKSQQVFRLAKSLYGLKQSPRNWFKKLETALHNLGFKQLSAADCVFIKGSGVTLVVLLVYVDDMIIMSQSNVEVNKTKSDLKRDFKITDLGPLEYFLGIRFERYAKSAMKLTQEKYSERVLDRFGMTNSRPVDTPMARNFLSLAGVGPKDDNERKQAFCRVATMPCCT